LINEDEFAKLFDSSFPDDLMKFLISKVWWRRASFAHYEFMDCRMFGTRTSNSCEIEGGVLKHHSGGPKPNQSIAKAADSVSNVSDMQITLKEQKAAKALYTVPVNLDPKLAPLYERVSKYCGNKVELSWKKRLNLTVFRASIRTFYVKLESYTSYKSDPLDLHDFL